MITELILKNSNPVSKYNDAKVRTKGHLAFTDKIQANNAGTKARKIKFLIKKIMNKLMQINNILFIVNRFFNND